jgi:hypothetical protein
MGRKRGKEMEAWATESEARTARLARCCSEGELRVSTTDHYTRTPLHPTTSLSPPLHRTTPLWNSIVSQYRIISAVENKKHLQRAPGQSRAC